MQSLLTHRRVQANFVVLAKPMEKAGVIRCDADYLRRTGVTLKNSGTALASAMAFDSRTGDARSTASGRARQQARDASIGADHPLPDPPGRCAQKGFSAARSVKKDL